MFPAVALMHKNRNEGLMGFYNPQAFHDSSGTKLYKIYTRWDWVFLKVVHSYIRTAAMSCVQNAPARIHDREMPLLSLGLILNPNGVAKRL
jgi:hypothetical protein